MPGRKRNITIVVVGTALVIAGIFAQYVYAQPGTDNDPVVSLSYLESSLALRPLALEGGEGFRVTAGRGIVLIEGSCRISPPFRERSWILDITSGEIFDSQVEMIVGHMYVPILDSDESVTFNIQAWRESIIAIPGGTGR